MTFEQWCQVNGITLTAANRNQIMAQYKTARKKTTIPNYMRFSGGEGSAHLIEAQADDGDDTPKLRSFRMNAYNGGEMFVGGFFDAVVVDIAGLKVTAKSRPILFSHDPQRPVGHTTNVDMSSGKKINIEGELSVPSSETETIIASGDNGFPWQASIGVSIIDAVRIPEGEKAEANGRTFTGPIIMVRKGSLNESSFVALGADDSTSSKVAANAAYQEMELTMNEFEKWLKAQGVDIATADPALIQAMKELFDAKVNAETAAEEAKIEAAKTGKKEDEVKASQATIDVEALVSQITEKVVSANKAQTDRNAIGAKHPEVLAQANAEGWDNGRLEAECKLADVLAGRPVEGFNVNAGSADDNIAKDQLLEVAMIQAEGSRIKDDDLVKEYSEQVVEAARKKFKGSISLQELLVEAAIANGYTGGTVFKRDEKGIFASAFAAAHPNQVQAAGFSTISLPGILSNVANKFFRRGFEHIESTWRQVSAIRNVSDFKEVTTYSLTGDLKYLPLGQGGEIEHGTLGEVGYGNKASTYARMIGITREDLVNDDTGALTTVMFRLGRGAALNFNEVFWAEFEKNTAPVFYASTAPNNNLTTTGLPLSIDELTAMMTLFLDQKDPDDNPMGIEPRRLVHPNALEVTANQLFRETRLMTGEDATLFAQNPHAGKYQPVRSSYLSSATATYLIADPNEAPVIETAFLNGREIPFVETADVDFNKLGLQMRGYHDFGVRRQEFRGGVKSPGA